MKDIEKFIKINLSCNIDYYKSNFWKRDNPKISIVISSFNGEVYLKPAVRSIQNQNFFNIEIIILDDASMDNSVKIIKELMKGDKRIKLIENFKNRGALYTKIRGILSAKGKYILILDQDNLYANKEVFTKLYNEAEKYNLDLLGFSRAVVSIERQKIEILQRLNFFLNSNYKKS